MDRRKSSRTRKKVTRDRSSLLQRLQKLRTDEKISAFSITEKDNQLNVWLRLVGEANEEVDTILGETQSENIEPEKQHYYLFGGELRPGLGIIRRVGGIPEGPAGTLTCLLASKDGRALYFAAAAHVLTNFWRTPDHDHEGSVYINRKGYPGTNSTRFLGDVFDEPSKPGTESGKISIDIGIVELKGEFELKQRTTGYGTLGEWSGDPEDPTENQEVMKCGAEETHWTVGCFDKIADEVTVYGPERDEVFVLKNQYIFKDLRPPTAKKEGKSKAKKTHDAESQDKELPCNPEGTPFAVPGDSGSLVVDRKTKRPLGMLIAGSVLDGSYVVTPFKAIQDYWTKRGLIMLRA